MPTRRTEQVAEVLQAELSELLRREMRDPRLGFVTIVGVDVSPDLRNARVHVSCYGDEQEQRESLRALRNASGFLRSEIARRVRLRTVPQFNFRLDHTMEEAEEVQRTLMHLRPELEAAVRSEERAGAAEAGGEDGDGPLVEAAPRPSG
jgi:ribosome-binding factor A